MAPTTENIPPTEPSQGDFHELLRATLRDAVRLSLRTGLQAEGDHSSPAPALPTPKGNRDADTAPRLTS